MVVAEAGWLIERQLGSAAEATFYRSIAAGELRVEALADVDWPRIAELVQTYADLGLGGTDASLVAIAERLNITTIATLDRRDFAVVRPRHVDAFTLLP
jgi:predicted nucleic acid-binding protein